MALQLNDYPFYDEKLRWLAQLARNTQIVGPPEAAWYGAWNHILTAMSYNLESLAPMPQYPFRARTAAEAGNTSTRYTDHGLISSRWTGIGDPKLLTRVIMAVEVKPLKHPNDLIHSKLVRNKLDEAYLSLHDQVVHLFASQELDPGRNKIIGVAAAGPYYEWFTFTRTEATRAPDFSRNIKQYLREHPADSLANTEFESMLARSLPNNLQLRPGDQPRRQYFSALDEHSNELFAILKKRVDGSLPEL